MARVHTFHIPVMGLGYTIDTPLKVAQYGIDSVISIVDDVLVEKFRKYHCEANNKAYEEITIKDDDYRADRIRSYLNLINELTEQKFDALKKTIAYTIDTNSDKIIKYFDMLPDGSGLYNDLLKFCEKLPTSEEIYEWLNRNLEAGSIDVNIMTKLDKDNYNKNEKLPTRYNDAHAALRGFAESELNSGLVLSAGMNPRLYSYMAEFDDFYPDADGNIRKRIILKVSDYRSALIQGKFLAKKGLWVSEFRIESGLNCGGHAFASDGYLMGPVMEEFKNRREELTLLLKGMVDDALVSQNKPVPKELSFKVTAQGGVGTAEEHNMLLEYYDMDSVGWGTPFMLVPEVTRVDKKTLEQMVNAREDDLYLSPISPVGVPFNSLRGASMINKKQALIDKGRPGSSCPRKFVQLNKEFTDKAICTASRQYQHLKIEELDKQNLTKAEYKKEFDAITVKECICTGLGASALMSKNLDIKTEGEYVTVCPGPNLAYFDKISSLKEMVDHIYGKVNIMSRTDRPNMFIKELWLYINYLEDKIKSIKGKPTEKDGKYFNKFLSNLGDGIGYYKDLFGSLSVFKSQREKLANALTDAKQYIEKLEDKIRKKIDVAA